MLLPIVQRELLCAARRPLTYWSRSAAVVLGALALFPILWQQQWTWVSAAALGGRLIIQLQDIAYYFTLVCGVWLTAGTLCKERAEGTLGLLFLTDLQARDVVFGKLAAALVQIGFGLLALLPFFMICALFGGVTALGVEAIAVKLFVTLLLSLSVGLLASALCQIERQAMMLSGVLIFLICFLPAQKLGDDFPLSCFGPGYLPPVYVFGLMWQKGLSARVMAMVALEAGLLAGLPLIFLAATWWRLGRTWRKQESWRDTPVALRSPWLARRFKSRRLRDENPFQWLATRWSFRRLGLWLIFVLVSVILGVYLLFNPTKQQFAVDLAIGLLFFLAIPVVFFWVAVEATNQLSLERSQGSLELLLTTRMTAGQVIRGQMRGILAAYGWPMALMLFLIGAAASTMGNPALSKVRVGEDFSQGHFIFFGLLFLAQITALIWVGMWRGLAAKSTGKALLQTLLAVFTLPAGLFFLVSVDLVSLGIRVEINFSERFIAAMAITGGYSVFLAILAWARLTKALEDHEALLGNT